MVRSTLNRAEAKYNVTTEFPSLGLHYAAASGDVGLVGYALSHGQPVNSVVDGVLPLHAACAGGNSQVVKLLIDHGADVNAQRLPRKYSSEKNRDASVPIIGATGSTPLHFAAANGNTEVLNLLLLHGAHADRADKHGVTPEMVAEENGWVECSDILRRWIADKDRDLRERETPLIIDEGLDILASPPSCRSKRLHVKRSMDTAFAMLKTADPPWKSRETLVKTSESSLLSSSPSFPTIDPNGRRPSLPQVMPPASAEAYRKQKPPSPRPRPRSAGTDSEQDESFHVYGRGGAGRKQPGSKYSLMTIFKRAHAEEDATLVSDDHSSHGSPALASVSIPGYSATFPPRVRSSSSSSSTPNLPETPIHPVTALHPNDLADPSNRSSGIAPQSPPTSLLNLPEIVSRSLTVDFQLALSEQSQFKDGDIKSIQPSPDDQDQTAAPLMYKAPRLDELPTVFSEIPGESERKVQPSPTSRPGILRAHNRMPSAQGSPLPRMLRFDSTSSIERRGKGSPRGIPAPLRSSDGLSSIPKSRTQIRGDTTASPAMTTQDLPVDKPIETGEGDLDENYGQILTSPTLKLNMTSMLLQRPRAFSFGSPSDAELSPIDSVNDSSIAALKSEFPFSMDDRLPSEDDVDDSLPAPRYLSVPTSFSPDKRGRGDSLSSNSTSSENRSNSHTSSSVRGTVSTPGLLSVLASPLLSDRPLDIDLSPPTDDISPSAITTTSSQSTTKSHKPTDIVVVSSHADAEALVHQTRQDVLDFADNQETSPISISSGRTPLSARLAAYGESLALEKKLREQKESTEKGFPVLEATLELPSFQPSPPLTSPQRSRDVMMERQHSLRERRTTPRHRRPPSDPRRPSTAEGVTSPKQAIFVRESPRSVSGQTQTLAEIKRNLLLESAPPLAGEKSLPPESVPSSPSGSHYLSGNYHHREESSGRSVDGADTTESDTIEQIIATPMSDPRKSAVKLTRMGYPAEAANVNRSTASPPALATTRFGAFKTFVQTLRSKT